MNKYGYIANLNQKLPNCSQHGIEKKCHVRGSFKMNILVKNKRHWATVCKYCENKFGEYNVKIAGYFVDDHGTTYQKSNF